MAKEYAAGFYKSKAWQDCRASFIANRRAIDGGICQRCHDRLGYIVHHKIHLNPYNIDNQDIALNHDNLEFVCKPCHDLEHFTPEEPKLLCHFDIHGRCIKNATTTERDESNN